MDLWFVKYDIEVVRWIFLRLCKLLDRSSIRLCISLSVQSLLFVVIDIIHNCHVFLIISLSVQSLLFVVIDIIHNCHVFLIQSMDIQNCHLFFNRIVFILEI